MGIYIYFLFYAIKCNIFCAFTYTIIYCVSVSYTKKFVYGFCLVLAILFFPFCYCDFTSIFFKLYQEIYIWTFFGFCNIYLSNSAFTHYFFLPWGVPRNSYVDFLGFLHCFFPFLILFIVDKSVCVCDPESLCKKDPTPFVCKLQGILTHNTKHT